jgi:3-phenylpropionate/trans-cinnamate dioxygenase ferredoxin subunit
LHGSRFSLKTGEPDQLPATKPIPIYPLTVVDGQVYVDLPDT